MATDIAFTLGILTVLGRRVPLALKIFFTALAIADDLGAVLVIALFYTADISWISLGVAAIFLLGLVVLNRSRVYATVPYAILGIGLWLAFLTSGVHPTIAGVLLAMTIPTRSPANTRGLLTQATAVLEEFELPPEWRSELNSRRQATVQTLEEITNRMQSPARRLEHELLPWSTYLILPIFAFANAGVALTAEAFFNLFQPVSLGVILGLVLGKPLGITLFSWVAVKLGLADLPAGTQWPQLFGASWLAGIGFTMSLFIANAAFGDPELLDVAKLAILVASLLAGLAGWGLLTLASPSYDRATQMGAAPAGQ
jgi:NhaA family Na+:H+ antiporter